MNTRTLYIEELLRDKLKGHRERVHEEDWLDFQARREKRSKRKPFFFLLIVLISTVVTVWGLLADDTGKRTNTKQQAIQEQPVESPTPSGSTAGALAAETEVSSGEQDQVTTEPGTSSSKTAMPEEVVPKSRKSPNAPSRVSPAGQFQAHQVDASPPIKNADTRKKLGNGIPESLTVRSLLPQLFFLQDPGSFNGLFPMKALNKQETNKKPPRPEFHPFGIYVGYFYASGQASWQGPNVPENEVNRLLTQSRTDEGVFLLNRGISFGVDYTTKVGFGLNAGLEYQSMNRNYTQTVKVTEFPILDSVGRIITYVPLQDSFHYENTIQGTQQISNVSIPLSVRQSIGLGSRVRIGVQVDLQLGLNWGSSYNSFDPITLDPVTAESEINPLNFRYGGGLFVNYRPTPFWGANITFQHSRANQLFRNSAAFNVQPRYYSFSVQLIRYL